MERNHTRSIDSYSLAQTESLNRQLEINRLKLLRQQEELDRTTLALEKARREFDQLRDNAPVAYVVHDLSGVVFEANRPARKLLGLPQQTSGNSIIQVLSEKGLELFRYHMERVDRNDRPVSVEIPLAGSGQNEQFVLLETSSHSDGRYQSVIVDVSSRIQSERVQLQLDSRLLHSQKMEILDKVSGSIAHDFNNILQVLVLQSELAKELVGPGERQLLEAVTKIGETADRGVQLTKRLLSFSRKKPLEKIRTDLNEVVADSFELLCQTVGDDWKIGFDLLPDRLGSWVDPVQIEQCLLNLCLNARDAMPCGGTIEVSTSRTFIESPVMKSNLVLMPGNYAVISVTDSGCGIPDDVLPKIFEPYFSTKEAGKGTGLGLPIVHSIMKQHAGAVEITQLDSGTRIDLFVFSFHLPDHSRQTGKSVRDEALRFCGTVLICDDDPAILNVLGNSLRQTGMEVYSAADGETAEFMIEELDQIDLLLTDVVVPGRNGRDVCRAFRRKFPDSSAVMMSGHGDSVVGEDFLRDYQATFLPKPFNVRKLKEVLGLHLIAH